MNVSQMICHRGYPSEEYKALTHDGYYVSLNRIPHGRENPRNRVVFLQHGFLGEGSQWVENLANNSLAFILADSGYDVWLGNSRGTSWSRKHQNLSADQVEFWDFSFHEMAMYDLPAMINFVLQKTGQKQIYYVGYSQGCTIAFIAFSSMPELAQKIKMFFALAPAVTMKHTRSPIMKMTFLLDSSLHLLNARTDCLEKSSFWIHTAVLTGCPLQIYPPLLGAEIGRFQSLRLWQQKRSRVPPGRSCSSNAGGWRLEGTVLGGVWVWAGSRGLNKSGFSVVPVSLQDTPPSYRLEEMPVPTAVWSGGEDWVADWRDVRLLLPRIAHLVTYVHISDWNHWDFIWGLDAPRRLYSSILVMMEGSW
uniref:AB hydrolase-1 domain-containing protein n=1 Tax=Athene cunicularia TaxID=194338 RepID=A0A663LL79_ATHCN